jgi:FAD/FMN-containing dehydrogenase
MKEKLGQAYEKAKSFLSTPAGLWTAVIIAVLLVMLAGWGWNRHLDGKMGALEGQIQANEVKIEAYEARTKAILEQIRSQEAQIASLQAKNDALIREVGKDAFKKAYSTPDSGVPAAFNALIDGARKRNAQRK